MAEGAPQKTASPKLPTLRTSSVAVTPPALSEGKQVGTSNLNPGLCRNSMIVLTTWDYTGAVLLSFQTGLLYAQSNSGILFMSVAQKAQSMACTEQSRIGVPA